MPSQSHKPLQVFSQVSLSLGASVGENLCRHKKHVVNTVSDQPSYLWHPVGTAPFASCLVKSPRVWHPGNAGNCQQLGMVTCSPPLIPTVNARPTHWQHLLQRLISNCTFPGSHYLIFNSQTAGLCWKPFKNLITFYPNLALSEPWTALRLSIKLAS